uniref:Ig-like domain-containing protein n=1 Tax=Clastoptera arizonana TaxID=38151 RepID=A0A1B6E5Z8_9HEMI
MDVTSLLWCFVYIASFTLTSSTGRSTLRHRQRGVISLRHSRDDVSNNITQDDVIKEYVVKQHEEVTLVCDLANSTGIRWLHNEIEMEKGHRYTLDHAGKLTISSVRLEDDGTWLCDDHLGNTVRPIRLVVLDPPKSPYLLIDGRRLDPGNLFIPVKENTELTVECVSEGGRPNPTLQWELIPYTGHEDTAPGLRLTNSSYVGPGTRSEATIVRVLRAHHNATVVCLLSHATLQGPLNASLLLDVQYTPSFEISRVPGFGFPIREGIPVSLKCDVDSNPPANPVWQKDGDSPPVQQSKDGFLNFTTIQREHSGWYKCTTKHILGYFSSIVYFLNVIYDAPELELTPEEGSVSEEQVVEVSLGETIQLQCPAGAAGCWSKVGREGGLDPVGPGPKLSLERILYQEAGEYRCVVARSARLEKWRAHNVHVTVTGQPVVYPSKTNLTASLGQEVVLSVEFCANPPATKVLWFTETLLLKPGVNTTDGICVHNVTKNTSLHCHHADLSISPIRSSHQGEFTFYVRSPRGIAEATIIVNVPQASGFVVTSGDVQHRTYIFYLLIISFILNVLEHF